MTHWIVIPYRGPDGAMSRLADALSPTARRQLSLAMFRHVLEVACTVHGARRVLVVASSKEAMTEARRAGAVALRERTAGLNEAAAQACTHLRGRGGQIATILAADLPLLTRASLERLIGMADPRGLTIAPDRKGESTNALTLPLGVPFAFKYGRNSAFAHLREGRGLKLRTRPVLADAFVCDLDVPADLDLLKRPGALSTIPALPAGRYRSA